MEWSQLPIDEIRRALFYIKDPTEAFRNILEAAGKKLPSAIWGQFEHMNIDRDLAEAMLWLQKEVDRFPNATGIYLGLDTLNMDLGYNVEIGLSQECDPDIFSDAWSFECTHYGKGHLIKGLLDVSNAFKDETKWTHDERWGAEYSIFLGYSGVVLREALKNLKIENDFLSIWGFHDGDMFFLVHKKGKERTVVSEIDL